MGSCRSHAGKVESFAKNAFGQETKVEPAGGSGYKTLRLVNGTAGWSIEILDLFIEFFTLVVITRAVWKFPDEIARGVEKERYTLTWKFLYSPDYYPIFLHLCLIKE